MIDDRRFVPASRSQHLGSESVGFDSVVFADSASAAALSCFARLKSERDAGRKTILMPLVDLTGAEAITNSGLATVQPFDDGDPTGSSEPFRERFSVLIRRLGVAHVMAPLGLLGAPQSIDYFGTLRAALSVDKGRDLLFFEERPECLVREAVMLRLSGMGVRLPPASQLRSPRRYSSFALRLLTGIGVPPIFGGLGERVRRLRSLKTAFREAADWDPQRALGPKLQPVTQAWSAEDTSGLFSLARTLGLEAGLGSQTTFRRRISGHAKGAGSRTPIERYWLSLPGQVQSDPIRDDSY